jgi:hypothetical protein
VDGGHAMQCNALDNRNWRILIREESDYFHFKFIPEWKEFDDLGISVVVGGGSSI